MQTLCDGVCSPGGGWRSALLDVAGAPGGCDRCLYTHFCTCFAAGDVAARSGGSYCVDCALGTFGCLYCLYGLCYGATRARLRAQHRIPGNIVSDCLLSTLLFPCTLSQQLNHLDLCEAGAALATSSAPGQRVAAAAAIPTAVVSFSGRARRLSDTALPPAAAAAAASAAAASSGASK
jgi:Cys-rich protein (TIGR01571 family)